MTGFALGFGFGESLRSSSSSVSSGAAGDTAPIVYQPISDIALRRASGTGKIELGNLSIPAGDFTIAVAVGLTTNAAVVTQPILSLGNASDTMFSQAGTLNIFGSLKSGTTGPTIRTLTVTGRDDAGNPISGRTAPQDYAASGRYPILTSEWRSSNFEGMQARCLFLVRRGANMEFWLIDPGCDPVMIDYAAGTLFATIAAKPAQLVMFNITTGGLLNNGNCAVQRFFRVGSALTVSQMRRVAQGVDPRQLVAFSAGAGDRLWAFTATSGTVDDLIAGQTATINGTFDNYGATKIIPSIITADEVRVSNFYANAVKPRTGNSTTSLLVEGTVTGSADAIYARVVEYLNESNIITDWQNLGTFTGAFSGSMTGVPATGFTRYVLQVRKGAAGTPITIQRQFGIGVTFMTMGQSIMQNLRLNSSGTIVAPATATGCTRYFGNEPGSQPDSYDAAGSYVKGWQALNGTLGYGETNLINLLASQLNCQIGSTSAADNGASIESYTNPTSVRRAQSVEIANIVKPKYIFWNQGQGSIVLTYSHNGGTGLQKPYSGALTGYTVSDNDFASNITVSDAQITSATQVTLTLGSTPSVAPKIRYQYGLPGPSTSVDGNGFGVAVGNALYDNRAPGLNTALGFPAPSWSIATQAVGP